MFTPQIQFKTLIDVVSVLEYQGRKKYYKIKYSKESV